MIAVIRPALALFALFTLLTGVAYPLAVTAFAGAVFPAQAAGSLIEKDGMIVGSALIGQRFADPKYFHPRPSAAGDDGYDGSSSSGSNLGPLSAKLIERARGDVARFREGAPAGVIPADAVTASGSGLDPHVAPAYARAQIARVAKARGAPQPVIAAIVDAHLERRAFGLLGEPRVNVLQLNLALDQQRPARGVSQ